MKSNYKLSFVHSLGVLVYVAVVSLLMTSGDKFFGQMQNVIAPIAFLLMFVISASVVGSLILGKPILLYLDGKKKEAVELFFLTIGWLAVFFVIFLVAAALR